MRHAPAPVISALELACRIGARPGSGLHRMQGLSRHIGWDAATLSSLPFAIWVRRLEIDFIRPVLADQEITITSFVSEFRGADGMIECLMVDTAGKRLSRALMVAACVDKVTNRGTDWPADAMALFFERDGR